MQTNTIDNITEQDRIAVTQLLGREPRGLEDIAVRDRQGVPVVIRVAPLVAGKPFPTLFWLIDKALNYAIDQVEAAGLIAVFQQRIDADESLQLRLQEDHRSHIALRKSHTTSEQQQAIDASGYTEVLTTRGIGGIADFQRIRCLHTYYAAHLVVANTIGQMLDEYWQQKGITFPHLIRS